MVFARCCGSALLCVLLTVPSAAQTRPPRAVPANPGTPDDAAVLAKAWTLIAQGSFAAASTQAQDLLRQNPRSVNALGLAVDAAIGLRGAPAGLDQYEHWLGARTLEEPGVLRRLARAFLEEWARQSGTRLAALTVLAGDGDAGAAAEISEAARQGGSVELRAMAKAGDEKAARSLIGQLNRGAVDPARTIEVLGESGYAAATKPIAAWLSDPRPEVRGAAAEALGKLGGESPEVAGLLTPLMSDNSGYVRTRAAAALYRVGDQAGTPWLQDLATSEDPATRLLAAESMASRPDSAWMALVTELATGGNDPEIRLKAARLLTPHNPGLARSVAQELQSHDNVAIRELSDAVMSESVSGDGLSALRRQLRAGYDRTRLRAATRILELTR
jgi:HEAT repeat protein